MNTSEDFLNAIFDPSPLRRRLSLPHPLQKFAAHGEVEDNAHADAILEFISHMGYPGSPIHRASMWLLLESEQAFFVACSKCGVDAEKLRSHLRLCQELSPDEMSNLLEARERRHQ